MITQRISIGLIDNNTGQVPGLPRNPRAINEDDFAKLLQSLRDLPEMMDLRELIVYPLNGRFVAIAGNMRLDGLRELKWKEAPCKVLDAATPIDVLKEIAIKDNIAYGHDDWAALNSDDWDAELLKGWGLEFPAFTQIDEPKPKNSKHQKQLRLSYSEGDYEIVKQQLSKIAETPELALWRLLGNK